MMSRHNWFLGILFSMAACGALINPPSYVAIAVSFFLTGLILLASEEMLIKRCFNWQVNGGIKGVIILTSLIIMCLIVPQVETNMAKLFTSPIAHLKSPQK